MTLSSPWTTTSLQAVAVLHPDMSVLVETGIIRRGQYIEVIHSVRCIPRSAKRGIAFVVLQLRIKSFDVKVGDLTISAANALVS